jgi:hypothetical protein
MLKKAEIRLHTRAAHFRECVFARVYQAATVRESVPDDFFSSLLEGRGRKAAGSDAFLNLPTGESS